MNEPRSPVPAAPTPAAPRLAPHPAITAPAPTMRPAGAPIPPAPGIARPAMAPAPARPGMAPAPAGLPGPAGSPGAGMSPQPGLPQRAAGGTINPAAAPRPAAEDEAISLVDDGDDPNAAPMPSKITYGADLGQRKHDWKRQTTITGGGAVRVKTFHAKLSDQGLEYLDEAINMFVDAHPEVDIKFVTTNVGMFDGKFKDVALVVNVWY